MKNRSDVAYQLSDRTGYVESGDDEKRMTMPGRPHRNWVLAHHDIAWDSGVTDPPILVLAAILPDVGPWSES